MTRFVYLSDTHLGADGLGWHQQKGYPERLREIVAALNDWIRQDGRIDFVLHGGDMTDVGTMDCIQQASDLFKLPVPIHLCLGNHDLTETTSLKNWLEVCPEFFIGGRPEYTVETEECFLHVIPNHWGDIPYCWIDTQNPHFLQNQVMIMDAQSARAAARPQILLTHSPVFGLPPEQTGMAEPFHEREMAFTETVVEWVKKQSRLVCVLGGHNHLNMRVEHAGVNYVTVSALTEVPFEFKVFEIGPGSLTMETISLASQLSFRSEYDDSKSYVQGREKERTLKFTLSPEAFVSA